MRSVRVVLPESMCAEIPMLRANGSIPAGMDAAASAAVDADDEEKGNMEAAEAAAPRDISLSLHLRAGAAARPPIVDAASVRDESNAVDSVAGTGGDATGFAVRRPPRRRASAGARRAPAPDTIRVPSLAARYLALPATFLYL
mmetsp:Transcript_27115/g.43420  ORF Transcript_27115/g.43420 Transcript_27115/m.43420 type:complete len:143 (-) Transcript_27115:146-574(-)